MTKAAQAVILDSKDPRTAQLRVMILNWWSVEARSYPWRQAGRTAYEILIAEVLLKRTTAAAVARVYEEFLQKFPSIEAIHSALDTDLEAALTPIGLYRQKAKGLKEMAKYLMETGGGKIPSTLSGLVKVPHIGTYTAAAVASFALNSPAAVIDSNVERIIGRVFENTLSAKNDLYHLADSLLPEMMHRDFNLALLDFGALVCRYVRPKCSTCPVIGLCDYGQKHLAQAPK